MLLLLKSAYRETDIYINVGQYSSNEEVSQLFDIVIRKGKYAHLPSSFSSYIE